MNKQEIKTLREKLPASGYVALVKKHTPKSVTSQQIRDLFAHRSVSHTASEQIIEAAIKVATEIKNNKTRQSKLIKEL